MEKTRKLIAFFVVAVVLFGRLQTVSAEDDGVDDYRRVVNEAVKEFEVGHWPEAIALFKRAHKIRPSAKTARGLGLAYFEGREYALAVTYMEEALGDPNPILTPEQKASAEGILKRSLGFTSLLSIDVAPADASLSIDAIEYSERPVGARLDPGMHVVRASKSGFHAVERKIRTEGGADLSLSWALEPLASSDGVAASAPLPQARPVPRDENQLLTTLGWVSGGLALAAGVTSIALWRAAEDGPVQDWLTGKCSTSSRTDGCVDIASSHNDLQTGVVVTAVGAGVLAAASATLFILNEVLAEPDESTAWSCGVGVAMAGCRGTF